MKYEKFRSYVDFIDKYRAASNAASGSEFDANANVDNKNVATLQGELPKGEYIGTNRLLMHDKIKELFGSELADEYTKQLENHEIYKHDETSIEPYCVSITMYPFLFDGLKGIGGLSEPPRHLDSFCGSFINLVFAIAAQFAGAVSTPEFLTYMDYFVRKEFGDDYFIEPTMPVQKKRDGTSRTVDDIICDKFAQVVYSLNQPAAARNFQSVFWNIAYFDENYFNGIFSDFVFPDGTEPKWESVKWLQKRFMTWFNRERTRVTLTFPVETMNLLNDGERFVDKEWGDFAAKMYADGHSFFTYTSNSVDSLASCCFSGDTQVYIRYKDEQMKKDGEDWVYTSQKSFKWLYENSDIDFEVVNGRGEFANAKVVKIYAADRDMYDVEMCSHEHMKMTEDHINVTWRGEIQTKNLGFGDRMRIIEEDRNWRYPLYVQSVTKVEREEYAYCFEMEDESDPYFVMPSGIVTHNCRLRNELQDNTFSFTLGAGGVSTGSKGVITINTNRLVQDALADFDMTKATLDESLERITNSVIIQVEKIHKYLIAFNEVIKDSFNARMLPVYDAGFISLDKQFLTIGVNGMVEGAQYMGIDISDNDEYVKYCEAILRPIYELNKAHRSEGIMFNTEYVPAENLGVKNARWDREDGYYVPRDCYNSYFYVVEDETCSIIDKVKLHGREFTKYLDGGSAAHLNLKEHLSFNQYKMVMEYAIKTGCSYFTFNVPGTACNDCGYISKHTLEKCPECGSENLDYITRIIGYLKRISSFSSERQKEESRRYYE